MILNNHACVHAKVVNDLPPSRPSPKFEDEFRGRSRRRLRDMFCTPPPFLQLKMGEGREGVEVALITLTTFACAYHA